MNDLREDASRDPAPSHGHFGLAGLVPALARWRRRQAVSPAWSAFAGLLAALIGLPLATIAVLSFTSHESVWPHLVSTVLPAAIGDTTLLLIGVGALTLSVGTGTAWLVPLYRFPGRGVLDRLRVLPAPM